MRRVKFTTPTEDCQILKLSGPRSFCLSSNHSEHQFLYGLNSTRTEIKPKLWAMFNNVTGNGIKVKASLLRDDRQLVDIGTCTFRIYLVNESTWATTLLYTSSGTKTGREFFLDATESNLLNNEVIGERTFYIEADLVRGTKRYKTSGYLNHLGIWDTALRTKLRVDFIEIEVI